MALSQASGGGRLGIQLELSLGERWVDLFGFLLGCLAAYFLGTILPDFFTHVCIVLGTTLYFSATFWTEMFFSTRSCTADAIISA